MTIANVPGRQEFIKGLYPGAHPARQPVQIFISQTNLGQMVGGIKQVILFAPPP